MPRGKHATGDEQRPPHPRRVEALVVPSPTAHQLPTLRPFAGTNGESLVRAFSREHRLALTQARLQQQAPFSHEEGRTLVTEKSDGGEIDAQKSIDALKSDVKPDDTLASRVELDPGAVSAPAPNRVERRHAIPPPLILNTTARRFSDAIAVPSHPEASPRRTAVMVGDREFRSIASVDDFGPMVKSSGGGEFSPLFPRDDNCFSGIASSPRRSSSTNPNHTGDSASPPPHHYASILSPRPLHQKPELTHPAVLVASVEVKIKDFSAKLLQKHGRASINWHRVRKVTCTPFQDAMGLSEATMFHCVLDIAPDLQYTSDAVGGAHGGGAAGSYGATSPSPLSGAAAISAPVWRRVWQRAKLSVAKKRPSGLSNGSGGGPSINQVGSVDEGVPVLFTGRDGASHGGNLNNFDVFNLNDGFGSCSSASSMRSSLALPPPPSFLVVKHYDTSVVESPNVLIRIARHLTATTAEKMVAHEIFFYGKLSGFFCEANSPFRCPKPMFISQCDRGDPGFLRYVFCGTGSGTVATIALEDMQRSGFSFDHTQGEGLFDETVIYSVLIALAYLHSMMWDRCHEPLLQKLEPAAILVFVHRGAPKLQNIRSKNEFAKVNLKHVLDIWASYVPTAYLAHRSARATVHYIRARWDVIRADALEIISRRDTLVHGDVHYKNIGFRTKYASSNTGSHSRRKTVGAVQQQQSAQGSAVPQVATAGDHSMLHRYFSNDNAILLRESAGSPMGSGRCVSVGDTENTPSTSDIQNPARPSRASKTSRDVTNHNRPSGIADEQDVQGFHDPSTPLAKQSAEAIDIQPCFLDYQSCGPGSIAAELLYFLCTSVPVEVNLDSHSASMIDMTTHIEQFQKLPSPPPSTVSPATAAPPSSALNSNSFAGLSPPLTDCTDDATTAAPLAATSTGGSSGGRGEPPHTGGRQHPSRSTSSAGGGRLSLSELLSFDIMLITTYHQNLDLQVQAAYPLARLIHDVYLLARHWAGCILFDMSSTPPEERMALKRLPQYARLIAWGERTAERCYSMCVAVFTEVDGPQLQSQLLQQQSHAQRQQTATAEAPEGQSTEGTA